MINPKYLILDVGWIRSLELEHSWFNARYKFRQILETILTKSENNINMLIMFNEKELIWSEIEDNLTIEDLEKIDVKYLNEIIDDIICKFYIELSASLNEDEHRDSYIFHKWLDNYSLMLERDDDY